jgi:succinyl-CoA synthetase beta subunit
LDLYEYQGKELLREHGLATLPGKVAETPEEARQAAEEIGGTVAVKAQVLVGGRGKAGGIKVVSSPEEAEQAAEAILGMDIKGHTVRRVYVEGGAEIANEMYLSVLVDREAKRSLVLFSTEGGVEIEQVAEENPDALVRLHIDPLVGLMPFQVREVTFASGLTGDSAKQFGKAFTNLYKTFESVDASLVEINPLVVTESGDVLALDAKVTVDNSSLYRHPDIAELHDVEAADPQEQRAQEADLQYVKLDGNVGILGNGPGGREPGELLRRRRRRGRREDSDRPRHRYLKREGYGRLLQHLRRHHKGRRGSEGASLGDREDGHKAPDRRPARRDERRGGARDPL